jgi:hypothetical protein
LVNSPNFPKDTEIGKEAIKNIKALQSQLKTEVTNDRQAASEKTVDALREKYGKIIVEVLSFF